jgi:tRNA nucleotidyltransferase (CCA-adding enzyme)
MIRAARYKLRYGFAIDERTMQLMSEAKQLLGHLSAERLRHELDLILLESDPVAILDHLQHWKLFEEISPALIWDNDTKERMNQFLKVPLLEKWPGKIDLTDEHIFNAFSYCLWFAMLSPDQINEIQQHLGFPVKLFNQIAQTSKLTKEILTEEIIAPSEWVSLLEDIDGIPLYVAYLLTNQQAILDYLTNWKNIHTKVDGDALRALGLKPGPSFQKIINAIKEARLNGIIQTDDEEQGFLLSILKEHGNQDRYD